MRAHPPMTTIADFSRHVRDIVEHIETRSEQDQAAALEHYVQLNIRGGKDDVAQQIRDLYQQRQEANVRRQQQ